MKSSLKEYMHTTRIYTPDGNTYRYKHLVKVRLLRVVLSSNLLGGCACLDFLEAIERPLFGGNSYVLEGVATHNDVPNAYREHDKPAGYAASDGSLIDRVCTNRTREWAGTMTSEGKENV
jgi:hypothetical protein